MSKINNFLNFHSRMFSTLTFRHALTMDQHCWDLACVSTLKTLVSLYRCVLKQILLKSTSPADEDFKTLCILSLKLRFELNKGIFMHKIMFESAPPYLKQLFQVNRSRGIHKITIAIARTDLFKFSLTYAWAVLWSLLPESLKNTVSRDFNPSQC